MLLESDVAGKRRAVVEYERFQSRRDAWGHIERFCGWLSINTLPFEAAVLYFVVDSAARMRGYVELIEAFADYIVENPLAAPANPVTLAVSTTAKVLKSPDPLEPRSWVRIELTSSAGLMGRTCVLHAPDVSPYDTYFSRGVM